MSNINPEDARRRPLDHDGDLDRNDARNDPAGNDGATKAFDRGDVRDELRYDAADRDRDGVADRDETRVVPVATTAPATTVDPQRRDLMYQLQMARMNNKASTDVGLLLLRLFPLMLVLHGLQKVMGFAGFRNTVANNPFGAIAPDVFAFLVTAGQVVLPILLAIGLFTRISGLLLAVMMGAIAFLFVFPNSGLLDPRTGGITAESALLYVALGLPLFFTGAGRYSIDHALGSRSRERRAEKKVGPVA